MTNAEDIKTDNNEIDPIAQRLEEAENTIVRLQADMQNMSRSFATRSKEQATQSISNFIKLIIPVFDAMEIASATNQAAKILWDMLVNELKKANIIIFYPEAGSQFDPNKHEVIGIEKSEESNVIVRVVQSGYQLDDIVIRPARVIATLAD